LGGGLAKGLDVAVQGLDLLLNEAVVSFAADEG